MDAQNPPQPSQDTESLVRRLAGPSVTKAGLANDQSEINRIITEVSKGSQFYENEKKKDRELTARIKKILEERDDVVKGADLERLEAKVDHLIQEIESQRDLAQIIVHVDMDAFFANVEMLHNPDLKGKAFGVGKGVLTTASYEARKYGVRSGMAGFIAKKLCPDLIFVQINNSRYSEMSRRVFAVFKRYDPNMAPAGCDEGYLNITQYCLDHNVSADDCVQEMRETVFKETGLTVSAGIAPNKMLAKICSDKNKPNGQFHLEFSAPVIREFMHVLSIRKIPGIGRVNERLLESIGIKTCGDIYTHRAVICLMDKYFGLHFLLRTYLGIASNTVQPHQREETKSIGAERTFRELSDKDAILTKLDEVATELEKDMASDGWAGKTVTLKYKLHTYQVFTRAKSLGRWITSKQDLFAIGKELLLPEMPLKIRLIGLRVTKLKDLRAPETGIKRFFESVDNQSPRKRRKLDVEQDDDVQPVDVETMPGFHEQDENDSQLLDCEANDDDLHDALFQQRSDHQPEAGDGQDPMAHSNPIRPPSSSTRPQSSTSRSPQSSISQTEAESLQKPSSSTSITPRPSHSRPSSSTAITSSSEARARCPVCDKVLPIPESDNQGLNAHIDFCLSRGVISEAQGEASIGTISSPASARKSSGRLKSSNIIAVKKGQTRLKR